MKQIDRENKQTLRGYAKTTNVLTQFAKELLEEDPENDGIGSELEEMEGIQTGSRKLVEANRQLEDTKESAILSSASPL